MKLEDRIVHRLQNVANGTPDYWDFREGAEDFASKCLFQYPAMMVPAMQKQVIGSILKVHPTVNTIADPFLGSGTILALAMLSGREFIGQDVNPLAILIAKTRAFSLHLESLSAAVDRVKDFARRDTAASYDVRFKRQAKWFTRGANIGISRLRRAIRTEENVNTRRFLWVCLAETTRLNSNSRTSTYKLHVRPESERNAKIEDVLTSFSTIAENNLKVVSEFRTELLKSGHLDESGNYKKSVSICYGDTAKNFPPTPGSKYQAVVTSPPYGDNKTTVPYGQAAWLPLQWIDLSDIDKSIPASAVAGYYDVDNRSLGGTRPRDLRPRQEILESVSRCAKDYISKLSAKSRDGLSRFVNFAFDLRSAILQFAANCDDGGYIVLTLGNRNICKTVCPLNDLCSELITSHNATEVFRITRRIPSKRMPGKNGHSSTINQEYIAVFRKAPAERARP